MGFFCNFLRFSWNNSEWRDNPIDCRKPCELKKKLTKNYKILEQKNFGNLRDEKGFYNFTKFEF